MPARAELRVAIEGLGEQETEPLVIALRDWLASEDDLHGRVRLHRQPLLPGRIGFGSGGIRAVLIQSVCIWLTSRSTDIKVTISAEDGRRIEVDVQRAADPQALLREIAEQFPALGSQSR